MEKQEYRYERIDLEQALDLIQEQVKEQACGVQEVSLLDALGRIAAEDCISEISQPPFDRSPLDGYGVRGADTAGASREHPVSLKVIEEVTAGDHPQKSLNSGEAVRIMTGAPIPEGADCIIRQEDTDYGEDTVLIYQEHKAGDNYCYAGEDFKAGDCLIPRGTRLGSIEMGILASMGRTAVSVVSRPKAAIFATGDELVEPGEPLAPGKIYNSNLYVLLGRCRELGIEPAVSGKLPDTEEGVAQSLEKVLGKVDLIVTTGGVSVGKKDIIHGALDLLGAEKIFWRVNVKPGTPTVFAMAGATPIVALSGNPFGALTHLELLVRPVAARLSGDRTQEPVRCQAVLQEDIAKCGGMRRFVRGYYTEGRVYQPKGLHSSGVLGSMQGCNCLIDVRPGAPLKAGEQVPVVLLEPGKEQPWWITD